MRAQCKERIMPIETIIVVTCISIAFVGFGLVLAWADHQSSPWLDRPAEHIAALT
jgi:hypothetical protein